MTRARGLVKYAPRGGIDRVPLPADYRPAPNHVIVARVMAAYKNHPANKELNRMLGFNAYLWSLETACGKSALIANILDQFWDPDRISFVVVEGRRKKSYYQIIDRSIVHKSLSREIKNMAKPGSSGTRDYAKRNERVKREMTAAITSSSEVESEPEDLPPLSPVQSSREEAPPSPFPWDSPVQSNREEAAPSPFPWDSLYLPPITLKS